MLVKAEDSQVSVKHSQVTSNISNPLFWLCNAIRAPKEEGIYISTGFLDADTGNMSLNNLSKLPTSKSQTSCWHALFDSAVIALEPSMKLAEDCWLELDFDVMVQLAAVEYPVRTDSGLVLLGYSTALIPVKRLDDGTIMWHLESRPRESRSQFKTAELSATRFTWFQTLELEELRSKKARLGWSSQARVLLGTGEIPRTVTWSKREIQSTSWRWAGANLQFNAQSTAPIQIGGQAGITFERLPTAVRYNPADNYLKLLHDSSREPIVLYDVSDKRAFLVPKLSVFHHMLLAYCKNQLGYSHSPILPLAQPGPDGGHASKEVLSEKGDFVIARGGEDILTLRELVMGFSINLARTSLHQPNGSDIYGYEFMDIVHTKPTSELGKTKLRKEGLSWAPLLEHIPCLFCSSLGDAISGTRASTIESPCNKLIKGLDFMAASMRCIDVISEQEGNDNEGINRSFPDSYSWTLSGTPFSPCQHTNSTSNCWEDVSFLQGICYRGRHISASGVSLRPWANGVVVFGAEQRKLRIIAMLLQSFQPSKQKQLDTRWKWPTH
jgi:hypothetical protein